MSTYTVRPLGGAAWATNIPTFESALDSLYWAQSLGLYRVVVIEDDTLKIVAPFNEAFCDSLGEFSWDQS